MKNEKITENPKHKKKAIDKIYTLKEAWERISALAPCRTFEDVEQIVICKEIYNKNRKTSYSLDLNFASPFIEVSDQQDCFNIGSHGMFISVLFKKKK